MSSPMVDQMKKMGLVREDIVAMCVKLRDMEERLLTKALGRLDAEVGHPLNSPFTETCPDTVRQKIALLEDPTVLKYLEDIQAGEEQTPTDENGNPDLS